MIERLIDVLVGFKDKLLPFFVMEQTDRGIILRFGKFHRRTEPGLNWRIPFVEKHVYSTCTITTAKIPTQTLTTKDGVSVVVSSVVKYNVYDPKPYILDIWDSNDVLFDVTQGAIKDVIASRGYEELNDPKLEREVAKKVRLQVKEYGFKIHRITFTDLGRIRSIRLLTDQEQ